MRSMLFPSPARSALAIAVAALVLAACTRPVEGDRVELRPAVIEFHGDPVVVTVPDTVAVGAAAIVTVRSYGGGCVDVGPTRVSVVGATADVRPLQRVRIPGPNGACTQELKFLSHVAEVRFTQPGTARVRVIGRVEPGSAPLEVERTIVVR